jgi:uncharacterized protein (AIM24 family)
VTDVDQRLACRWCRAQNPLSARVCDRCGAPLDVRETVTDSGWRSAPRLRDLTEITFGNSVFQLDGTVVPVADLHLGTGETVFFEHHVMLWKDDNVAMSVMSAPGGMKRLLGNLPFVLSIAHGPGRVSFSRDAPGELVILPIDTGVETDVREHAMIVATGGLTYSFEKLGDLKATLAVGSGMYLERYRADSGPGLLVLHGYGNVFERTLAEGETIQIEPGGFLYKEASVQIETVTHKLTSSGSEGSGSVQSAKGFASRGLAGLKAAKALRKEGLSGILSGNVMQSASGILTGPGITLMRVRGPGRVGIQSMFMDHGSG